MPRSLSQAGLGRAPVWVTAEMVSSQPFYIGHATTRTGKYGEQVVLKLRLRDGVYDADGEHHKIVHVSLTANGGQREDLVNYFRLSNDPLGPCMFVEVPTREGLNPFWQIQDVEQTQLPAPLRDLPQLPPRNAPRASDDLDDLEDLPF